MSEATQVWCVVYDGDPRMDGSHEAIRTHEVRSVHLATAMREVIESRSLNAPKSNLRIETRFVSEWVET